MTKKNGFTLIEISIVIVVIGLLIGGILLGKDLIRAAELRSIISESDAYKTAANTFKLKYNAIPSDLPSATSYFGAKANCSDTTNFTATCNGNNNGIISVNASTVTIGNEQFLFWQHLALAGLIAGNFNGVEGSLGTYDIDLGINTPKPKISGASWAALYQDFSNGSDPNTFKMNFGNYLAIGIADNSNGWINRMLLTPSETWAIDIKIDDGKPAASKFVSRNWQNCTNAATFADFNADYNLTRTTASCIPQFIKNF